MMKADVLKRMADLVTRLEAVVDNVRLSPSTVGNEHIREIEELDAQLSYIERMLGIDIDDFMAWRYQHHNEDVTRQLAIKAGWDGEGAIPYHFRGDKVRRLFQKSDNKERKTG